MEAVNHFSHKHPLIFAEKLENEDKKEVVCSGCEEPISGPSYKCSGCNFFLHKSCIELPHEIQHRLHPNHTLNVNLQTPEKKYYCDACCENCSRCFFYRCDGCNFNLDIKCASRWRINNNDCHKHAFIPISEDIQFSCQVCGEEGKDIAYLCTTCRLLVHHKCATSFQRTIHISAHKHQLTLTYSLHDQEIDSNKVFCRLCYKKVNTKYAIYYCQECRYIVHLNCPSSLGHRIPGQRDTLLKRVKWTFLVHLLIRKLEDKRAGSKIQKMVIQHSHNDHDLFLRDEKLEVDMLCKGCMQLISAPFYSCPECNFFLHERCANLASKIDYPLHEHPLALLPHEKVFYCDACNHLRRGFSYICDTCPNYRLDIQCYSIPETFKHEGHQHPLYLAICSKEKCYACHRKHESQGLFVCTECEFALGFECATLPLVAQHEYDTHLLQLTNTAEDCFEEYYCLICEQKREPNYWFYYCTECDFPAHPQCVLDEYACIKIF